MLKEELIKKLEKIPNGTDVILLDHRMNCHYADGEGTTEGIYSEFDIHDIELIRMDSRKPYNACALSFTNHVDFDKDCDREEH